MGSSQSYVSPEAAITAFFIAGAIGFGYSQVGSRSTSTTAPSDLGGKGSKGQKKKKALKSESTVIDSSSVPAVVAFPTIIPGSFEASDIVEDQPTKKPKKTKKKKTKPPTPLSSAPISATSPAVGYSSDSSAEPSQPKIKRTQQPSSSSSQVIQPLQKSISVDTDGSWTRVEGRRSRGAASASEGHSGPSVLELTTSDAGITTPVTGSSSPLAERTEDESNPYHSRGSPENRRTLAERLLPKPRKTGVDDMLETPDHPALSRVMRVQPNESPAPGFSLGDYEDGPVVDSAAGGNEADGEDDGWGVVRSKGRPKIDRGSPSQTHAVKAPDTLSKRQRQNANQRNAKKAAKAEAEVQRLSTLAKHKQELERVKMLEQFAKSKPGKNPSGGMQATVDERGNLVWE